MSDEVSTPEPEQPGQSEISGEPEAASGPGSWDEAFKHPRFKQLIDRAKAAEAQLEKLRQAEERKKNEELKAQSKFQELYEAEQAKAAGLEQQIGELRTAMTTATVMRAVEDAARRHDPPFTPAAIADLALFVQAAELADEAGQPKGVEAAVKRLAKDRPYLLEQRRSDPGSPAGQPKSTGRRPQNRPPVRL